MSFFKKEVATSTDKLVSAQFAVIDEAVDVIAKSGATLEDIIAATTPMQYEVRHAVMLSVVGKRLQLPCPQNFVQPETHKFDWQRGKKS